MVARPIYDSLQELRVSKDDLQRASYQMFDGIFARYVGLLRAGTVIGDVLDRILPPADFDSFWKDATATMGGMLGSAKLAFPGGIRERVAMQRALVLRVGDPDQKPGIRDVTFFFFHSGNSVEGHYSQFVSQVIEPFHRDVVTLLNPYLQEEKEADRKGAKRGTTTFDESRIFVAPERIERFRQLNADVSLDLGKLIRLCEELNLAYGNSALYSVASLTRTVINHIAPALGHDTFAQVAAHATPKHFKLAAEALETSARKVADFHLHETICDSVPLPTDTQVDVRSHLDVVLAEVERALSRRAYHEKTTP
jgi:hypothetical protein